MPPVTETPPPEKTELALGFVPLSDCAPLVAAYEKGFFEHEGLRVTLHRERSWASIRDKTAFGVYDAAQMLYPMPLASTLGVGGPAVPMIAGLCLGLGGNAITVGEALYQEMAAAFGNDDLSEADSAPAVAQVIHRRRAAGRAPLTFGCVFPTCTGGPARHWAWRTRRSTTNPKAYTTEPGPWCRRPGRW